MEDKLENTDLDYTRISGIFCRLCKNLKNPPR
jgi:hypothetical protein